MSRIWWGLLLGRDKLRSLRRRALMEGLDRTNLPQPYDIATGRDMTLLDSKKPSLEMCESANLRWEAN
jgi:hypothetical protein